MYFEPGQDIPMFGDLSTQFNYLDSLESKPFIPKMSFIDLPSMNLQAHCHEGANGTTHFKKYIPDPKEKHISILNSYQFAIGDLHAKALGLKTIRK